MPSPYQPEMIQIEVNTDCDLRCPFCPMQSVFRGRPKHRVSFEEFQTVFTRNFGGQHLTIFSGFSETLLNPDVWQMIAFEKSRNNMVFLATNGMQLDAANVQNVLNARVDKVVVTLDALDPTAYRRLRHGDVDQVIGNLAALQSAIERAGAKTEIILNYVVMRSTVDGIEPFLAFMRERGLKNLSFIKIMKNNEASNPFVDQEFLSWDEYGAIDFDRIYALGKESGIFVQRSDTSVLRKKGCDMPATALYVSATWDVSCCPFLVQYPEYVFGNLQEQTIQEIYDSPRFAQLRAKLAGGAWVSPCEDCACLFSDSGHCGARSP